ncbi:hypothetical protein AB0876_07435 [Mycobacterium sp. NPDC049093]
MGLNVADIDRWDSAAINAVSQSSAVRAEAASRVSGSLGSLTAFQSWSGQGSAAALQQTQARASDLLTHVQDSTGVSTAARTAANEVSQVKSQLAALRSTAGAYGIVIDAATSRVIAPSVESLQAASKKLVETMVKNTQSAVDKLLQAANKADDLLAKAFEPGEKKKLLEKSKEFDPKNKKERDFGSRKDEKKDGKDKDGKDKDGKNGDDKSKKGPGVKLYEKEVTSGKASVYSKETPEGKHTFDNGVEVKGTAGVDVLSAEAKANVEVTSDGISAGANANATLVGAEAKGSATYGIAEAEGEVRAAVEADATANASIGADGVNLEAEAFAGARLTGDASVDVGGVGVGAHGELQAGIGVSGDLDAGFHDGKLKIGGSVGAALGVGGKVGFEVEIDPGKVTDTIKDGAKKVGKWFGF